MDMHRRPELSIDHPDYLGNDPRHPVRGTSGSEDNRRPRRRARQRRVRHLLALWDRTAKASRRSGSRGRRRASELGSSWSKRSKESILLSSVGSWRAVGGPWSWRVILSVSECPALAIGSPGPLPAHKAIESTGDSCGWRVCFNDPTALHPRKNVRECRGRHLGFQRIQSRLPRRFSESLATSTLCLRCKGGIFAAGTPAIERASACAETRGVYDHIGGDAHGRGAVGFDHTSRTKWFSRDRHGDVSKKSL
jgi:hypothetical protein